MRISIAGFLFLLAGRSAFAGGSVWFEDVIPVLQQKPEVYKSVQHLDIGVGDATRLGNQTNFGGARIGPYTFAVKTTGEGAVDGTLVIHTTAYATDGFKNKVDIADPQAKELHENLVGIELKLGDASAR